MKKGFMLEQDAGDHFLLRHTDGHMLKVAKNGVSPEVRKVIASFASGGNVEGYYGGGGVEAFREKAAEDNMPVEPEEKKEREASQLPSIQIGTVQRPGEIFQPMNKGGKAEKKKEDPTLAAPLYTPAPSMDPTLAMQRGQYAQNVPPPPIQAGVPDVGALGRQGVGFSMPSMPQDSPVPMSPRFASVDERDRYVAQQRAHGVTDKQMAPQAPAAPNYIDPDDALISGGPQPTDAQPAQPTAPRQMMGGNIQGDLNRAEYQMSQGLQAEAKAMGDQGQDEARELALGQLKYDEITTQNNANLAAIQKNMDSVSQSIMNHEIDPRRAWNNRSTESKVLGIFGMLLSGVGAGMSGQENMAMKLLNKQIDDDIKSQETDLGRKKTLLDGYMKQYGNVQDASKAAKLDLMTMVDTRLKMFAAENKGPLAAAKAQQASSTLLMEKAKIAVELAGKMTTQQQQQSKQLNEVEMRRKTIERNLRNLELAVSGGGIYEMAGPHNQNINRWLNDVATDFAKLKDPESIARPGEVELERSGLMQTGIWDALTTRDSTALNVLKQVRKDLTGRVNDAYSVRGFQAPAPAPTPVNSTAKYKIGQR